MDEYLRAARAEYLRKVNSGTVPAKNHIKKLIRLRDPGLRYKDPGFVESDTVLHCGHYIWGTYGLIWPRKTGHSVKQHSAA
jgi:hypothetical protein